MYSPHSRYPGLLLLLIVTAFAQAASAARSGAPKAPKGVNSKAYTQLYQRAEETQSDAVVVLKDGKLIAEWYFGKPQGPIEAMSTTKSVVSIAIGRLIDTGRIKSLDQPVHEFYPEWRQGRKKNITLRHLPGLDPSAVGRGERGCVVGSPYCNFWMRAVSRSTWFARTLRTDVRSVLAISTSMSAFCPSSAPAATATVELAASNWERMSSSSCVQDAAADAMGEAGLSRL